ncbi:MAG: hypothetical protein R3D26_09470 [Cyanobacteriota/Melainabacteria group bacterium]
MPLNSLPPPDPDKEWAPPGCSVSVFAQENRNLARLIAPYPTDISEVIKTVRERR